MVNSDKLKREREPLLYVAVGKKGVGKTFSTITLIENYLKGNKKTGAKPRKVLIIDVNQEFVGYKSMAPEHVKLFTANQKIECRRILPIHGDGTPMKLDEIRIMLEQVLSEFKGGLILIEDIRKYVGDNVSADIIGALCTLRHRDTDVIVHFQGIGMAGHPKIKANMNILRFHRVSDTVSRHKNKFEEQAEILYIAENIVNKKYDDEMAIRKKKGGKDSDKTWSKSFVYVNFDNNKLVGNFSKEDFMAGVVEYISENEGETIGRLLKKKDRNGNKMYSYAQSIEMIETSLFDKYYGNKK